MNLNGSQLQQNSLEGHWQTAALYIECEAIDLQQQSAPLSLQKHCGSATCPSPQDTSADRRT
jgi:hypothetical protein